ncbi:uncharacterized protein E5676_scaffold1607G00730 [Cucumis melo var. makuwa]|uniref:Transposase n=2 Tax=Cucumis melo var. makuwa TaxID=1194695 RepID=A0A5D3DJD9_CUCMM|nr:uncharacterized protein E5676_scaffold1607G00730 [Cucumis melo var. makuwa]
MYSRHMLHGIVECVGVRHSTDAIMVHREWHRDSVKHRTKTKEKKRVDDRRRREVLAVEFLPFPRRRCPCRHPSPVVCYRRILRFEGGGSRIACIVALLEGVDYSHVQVRLCIDWKEFPDLQHYPTCGEARYKEESADMKWHKDKRVETDDVLRHPADIEGWKHFDSEFSNFASEPRNVRLGLGLDGFNQFGQMSTSYSMWPVVLLPYNLSPWKCMKEIKIFMSLLIPDFRSSGREIDVYLQPFIEELKELWTFGDMPDVMHIEKNICDNLIGTLLNVEGKTTDTTNAQLDL